MSKPKQFSNIKACVFDAYGTLFDVHSAMARHRARLGDQADTLSALWRTKQLEYTWLRSLMGKHAEFWQVTGEALDYAMAALKIDDKALHGDLMQAYLTLDCYPEVPEVLQTLKSEGMQLAILSNGSPDMLKAAVDNSNLSELLNACWSIETVGIYKPAPVVYELACKELGLDAAQISFQSSNAWDAAGAAAFGMRVAWVNRFGQQPERLPDGPDAELTTLKELPELLGV